MAEYLIDNGAIPLLIKHSNVLVFDSVVIHDSAILSLFTCISSDTTIGKFFHANVFSFVAHDCSVGDFVTFGPGVKCNGNVMIKNHAYIGAGAVIKQGSRQNPIIIGEKAVVGMGAIVTKSISAGTVVIGNPARQQLK
ncbi:hypothetical protein [Buttiauxella gaviniae]|uniref:hypothetical protein n=1 Tax=Buttiauxella gaviniae TaxID=82990 RepID=UPI003BB5ED36